MTMVRQHWNRGMRNVPPASPGVIRRICTCCHNPKPLLGSRVIRKQFICATCLPGVVNG
jgi:hypothetical protein